MLGLVSLVPMLEKSIAKHNQNNMLEILKLDTIFPMFSLKSNPFHCVFLKSNPLHCLIRKVHLSTAGI